MTERVIGVVVSIACVLGCDPRKAKDAVSDLSGPTHVVDESTELKEGASAVWHVPHGTYHLRVVASPDGAKTQWTGAPDCRDSRGEQKEFDERCVVSSDAQLTVKNPTTLGLGSSIVATVVLERE